MTHNVVGIDVHKHQHVAAMIDQTGREIATITIANTPNGYEKFVAWLHRHDAQDAKVGIENAASYGQQLTVALCAAGLECVDVPPWRTHRHRKTMGPGKSDPIDAQAIARVVLLLGEQLAPALQPELARALGILTTVREQEVRDRTKTIMRLRAIWAGVNPADEAACKDLAHPTQVRRLRRLTLPVGLVEQTAQDAIRMLARRIAEHNDRLQRLEADMALLLEEHGDPFEELTGAATLTSAKLISHRSATPGGSRTQRRSRPTPAPHRSPPARGKPQAATASTAPATANSTPRCTRSRSSRPAATPTPAPISPAVPLTGRPHAKHAGPSNDASQTSSTAR